LKVGFEHSWTSTQQLSDEGWRTWLKIWECLCWENWLSSHSSGRHPRKAWFEKQYL